MKPDNIIQNKSYQFALRMIKLYRYLVEEKNEYVLSKQVLRCGTSIGANVEEAIGGQSEKDFLSKISIAYKEARETNYWLRLMRDSNYLPPLLAESLLSDCDEIIRILGVHSKNDQNTPTLRVLRTCLKMVIQSIRLIINGKKWELALA